MPLFTSFNAMFSFDSAATASIMQGSTQSDGVKINSDCGCSSPVVQRRHRSVRASPCERVVRVSNSITPTRRCSRPGHSKSAQRAYERRSALRAAGMSPIRHGVKLVKASGSPCGCSPAPKPKAPSCKRQVRSPCPRDPKATSCGCSAPKPKERSPCAPKRRRTSCGCSEKPKRPESSCARRVHKRLSQGLGISPCAARRVSKRLRRRLSTSSGRPLSMRRLSKRISPAVRMVKESVKRSSTHGSFSHRSVTRDLRRSLRQSLRKSSSVQKKSSTKSLVNLLRRSVSKVSAKPVAKKTSPLRIVKKLIRSISVPSKKVVVAPAAPAPAAPAPAAPAPAPPAPKLKKTHNLLQDVMNLVGGVVSKSSKHVVNKDANRVAADLKLPFRLKF